MSNLGFEVEGLGFMVEGLGFQVLNPSDFYICTMCKGEDRFNVAVLTTGTFPFKDAPNIYRSLIWVPTCVGLGFRA